MNQSLMAVRVRHEQDVVAARQRAHQIASALGFDVTDQTRIATAVSELARNAFEYAEGGIVEFGLEGTVPPQVLVARVSDSGRGIANLEQVLSGTYRSRTGMGLGIMGARRLADHFEISSGASGTTVCIKRILPSKTPLIDGARLARITSDLANRRPRGAVEEVQQQNQELLRTLDELRARQEEIERVNRELEDTNRGVVALYAELDERADHLRRADELKTKFLSNMTHEFRTPVNSILALTNLLADRIGGAPDQKDELYYIRKSAQQLSDLVDDLLDIAKVEAGKIEVRPAPFEVAALFGALRGMLRPLLVNQSLALVFEEPDGVPPILSDENKVSQILRNFISNALKYTEQGEVRVTARLTEGRDAVEFAVADTGIGIPEQDLARVFDEFVQIENPLQRRVKGTGLGLPLSKRLAELLGGTIGVASTLGAGSRFAVTIPLVFHGVTKTPLAPVHAGRDAVLVIEDADEDMLLYERALGTTRFQVVPARSVGAALAALDTLRPAAIVMDIRLHGQEAWDLLARLKRDDRTRGIPLVVVSTIDDRHKGFALGADAYGVKPISREWLLETLEALTPQVRPLRVLAIDDEEAARFIVRELLNDGLYQLTEAASGAEGLRLAQEEVPDVLLLDFRLTDMTGIEVCDRLRRTAALSDVPVIVVTSHRLSADDRERFGAGAKILSKSALTRDALRSAIQQAVPARGVHP